MTGLRTVAALYVDPRGPYPKMEGVECWDATRDARNYNGPHPIVAHPPCQLWGAFAPINFKRWGGEHNRPGNDGGCFEHAFKALCTFGGVLEHPANSKAWDFYGLRKPARRGWVFDGLLWTCEIWQSAYGHLARKRTWLAYSGPCLPPCGAWERKPGTHRIGHDHKQRSVKPRLAGAAASRTPPLFAEFLVSLARSARP